MAENSCSSALRCSPPTAPRAGRAARAWHRLPATPQLHRARTICHRRTCYPFPQGFSQLQCAADQWCLCAVFPSYVCSIGRGGGAERCASTCLSTYETGDRVLPPRECLGCLLVQIWEVGGPLRCLPRPAAALLLSPPLVDIADGNVLAAIRAVPRPGVGAAKVLGGAGSSW
jgi:hypothetical protein